MTCPRATRWPTSTTARAGAPRVLAERDDVARNEGHALDGKVLGCFFMLFGMNPVPEARTEQRRSRHYSCIPSEREVSF